MQKNNGKVATGTRGIVVVQVEAGIKFGQNCNLVGNLVLSILSVEITRHVNKDSAAVTTCQDRLGHVLSGVWKGGCQFFPSFLSFVIFLLHLFQCVFPQWPLCMLHAYPIILSSLSIAYIYIYHKVLIFFLILACLFVSV
jgi:hypothetical protein